MADLQLYESIDGWWYAGMEDGWWGRFAGRDDALRSWQDHLVDIGWYANDDVRA
jgi:hypothetical protein